MRVKKNKGTQQKQRNELVQDLVTAVMRLNNQVGALKEFQDVLANVAILCGKEALGIALTEDEVKALRGAVLGEKEDGDATQSTAGESVQAASDHGGSGDIGEVGPGAPAE